METTAQAREPVTTEEDLDRCARGQHRWRPIEDSDSLVICVHCRQVDEVPDCMFYVSPEQPECGEPGYTFIRVTNRGFPVRVAVCRTHKAKHDEIFARARHSAKTP
jgi:hypothetical protein